MQASEYQFDSGVFKARRWNIGGSTPELETVCDHVEAVRVRYFDGKEWKASFDSLSAGALPVAVEVAVWFGTPKKDENAAGPAARPAKSGGTKGAKTEPDATSDEGAPAKQDAAAALPSREPDRLRVIVVPDGPAASWKDTR